MSSFELIPLFSGSSGNSTLIRVNDKCILIDAGRSCKLLKAALLEVGTDPNSIDAIFVTHSHSDHICGIDVFVRNFPTKIYATEQTHRAIARCCKKCHEETPDIVISHNEVVDIGDGVLVECCSTPHDAHGSCCYKVSYDNRSVMVMTDLGYVTDDIRSMAAGVDGILIESNYDRRMLVYGPYPQDLKVRIAGNNGHLSNDDCAAMIEELINSGTSNFILGHLSEENNTPSKALECVTEYLGKCGFTSDKDYYVRVANRHTPTEGISV